MKGKFILAIVLCAFIFIILVQVLVFDQSAPQPLKVQIVELRDALWNVRTLDVVGQLALLFTATYGVLALVKERQ
ncbi:MAG: hypothetical protein ACLFWB_01185 [Armatimonadota bacterium]